MRYIHLNDDSYIIHMTKGMVTLNRKSFNFNKIKRMLRNDAAEGDILPLLTTPCLNDGIYQAYLIPKENIMFINHLVETPSGMETTTDWLSRSSDSKFDKDDIKFMGVYASKADLIADWPEYTI